MEQVKATSDVFFKYLFGRDSSKGLLMSFLNAVLSESDLAKIRDVELKNPFNLQEIVGEKGSILDIKATDENGRIFDVEMQAAAEQVFATRSLYYWAKLYSGQLEEGNEYEGLRQTMCINVLDFMIFPDLTNRFHTSFWPTERKNPEMVLTDQFLIHYLELPKLRNEEHRAKLEDSKLLHWLYYLRSEGKEKEAETMKILLKDEDIAQAHEEFEKFNSDEKLRYAALSREKWVRDQNSRLARAKREGIEQGIERGVNERSIEVARNLKTLGIVIEDIEKATGLSVEQIDKL